MTDKKLILVAEDDLFNFMYIEEILTTRGFCVLHARTGIEAVKLAQENDGIIAVLMDIKMPEIDGYEAFTRIRAFNKNIPIIAQTAYALTDEIDKIINHGFTDVITKPIKVGLFLQKLNKHIN